MSSNLLTDLICMNSAGLLSRCIHPFVLYSVFRPLLFPLSRPFVITSFVLNLSNMPGWGGDTLLSSKNALGKNGQMTVLKQVFEFFT